MGKNDLERVAVLKKRDGRFQEMINLLRKKEQLFNQGRSKLELGLNQEKRFIEERAFSALKLSLQAFESKRSVSNAAKEIKVVYNSLFMSRVGDNLKEGRELLGKAKAIKIQVEEYLSGEEIQ